MQQDDLGAIAAKPWWQSRTMIGAAITGGSALGALAFGFSLDAETQRVLADQVTTWIIATAMLGGTVLTIVGRAKATKAVTLTKAGAARVNAQS